jgi:hypothetical protein
VTPAPTSTISAEISWPMMRGNVAGARPARMCSIVSPAPQANTRATASPGPAFGSGRSSMTNGAFAACRTMAFIENSLG